MFVSTLALLLSGLFLMLLGYLGLCFAHDLDEESLLYVGVALLCFVLGLVGFLLIVMGVAALAVSIALSLLSYLL